MINLKELRVVMTIEGLTTLSPAKMFDSPKDARESHAEHDERCWRERLTVSLDGYVMLPPLAIKKALETAAKMRSDSIPGKGKQTYSKHVASGLIPDFDILPIVHVPGGKGGSEWVPLHPDDVVGVVRHVPSDGKVGGGKRVPRRFPEIQPPWRATQAILVVSQELRAAPDRIKEYLDLAGVQVGICRFRPSSQSAGWYGRFRVSEWNVEAK